MTVTMVIIIVAGVVIIAFGVLCLLSMNKAQRETQNMAEKMIAVERNLGDVSRMVSRSAETSRTTDETIILELQRQAKKQAELEAGMAQVRAQREVRSQAQIGTSIQGAPPEDTPQQRTEEGPVKEVDLSEIDINDLLDDLEDILPDIEQSGRPEVRYGQEIAQQEIVQPKPEFEEPQIRHFDYDIGKSGKKYTASELEMLIRE
mgnify:CR=1 FL=1